MDLDALMDNSISAKDVATLETMLGDDFVYTHSTERSDPRPAFLAWVAGRTPNSRRELSDIQVEFHDDIAVTRANLDIVYLDESRKYLRYVRVYRRLNDGWKLISSRTVNATDREP
jgi:ketosteroid isomerase-like protein